MNASGPIKVLGAIAAMETFVENFPMSILDLAHGPTYTSVFVFLIDILRECNIPIQKIANRLIEKIFGIDPRIEGGVNTIYQRIMDLEIDEQSEFLKNLETGVKTILMALLASIFSCSSIPYLPTRYFDTGRIHFFGSDDVDNQFDHYRGYINSLAEDREILIPTNVLNSFGYLDINPFTNAGKLYFSVDGGDKCYMKVDRGEQISNPETMTVPDCDRVVRLFVDFGEGHAEFLSGNRLYCEDEIQFRLTSPVEEDIQIAVQYTDSDNNQRSNILKIRAGEMVSEIFLITPKSANGQKEYIRSISIIGGGSGKRIEARDERIYVYLSRPDSSSVIRFWETLGNESLSDIEWGSAEGCGTKTVDTPDNYVRYQYVQCDKMVEDAVRMKYVPTEPTETDPEYIISYSGLDPNTLCRTEDMNAFIWYIVNRSMEIPQSEKNKNMWDNRIVAKKNDIIRETDADWNNWYNSKPNASGELGVLNYKSPDLYPIVQLRNLGNAVGVKFPAQTYFKPHSSPEDGTSAYRYLRMNATIYKFNYDYLQSIKIFNPRVLIFGMFDALLNGALSVLLDIHLNLTRKETDARLSSAIKKIIEADDATIEDCFYLFSNEDYDKLLSEMLLGRYDATYTGGEVNRATQHNLEDYLAQIDSVNFSSSAVGETTKITKLVTEISATAGNEGTIEYGINAGIDEGWWKRLIWAIALPIIKCIFTPQVLMLFMINFKIMGITSLEDLWGNNQAAIIRLIINKILGLVKSIVLFIKDKLAEILFDYFIEVVLPVLAKYQLLKLREKLDAWISLLAAAILCLPRLKFNKQKPKAIIDEVDYADIINEQTTPETTGGC